MLAEKNASGHSIFGPSSAHRWMRCPRSLIEGHLAGDRPTFYAAEGSVAHWLAEDWLTHGNPWRHEGTIHVKDGFEIEITPEMISYIEDYVSSCTTDPLGQLYVEVKVDLSQYTPVPSFGTSDCIRASWQKLKVKDLKYGKVWVDATDNEQGQAYALGAFHELDWLYDFQEIEIEISQPRRENFDSWTITRAELLEFGERYRIAAHEAWNPDAPYRPDPVACEYCPARITCPARADAVRHLAQGAFDDIPDGYTPEQALAVINSEVVGQTNLPRYHDVPLATLSAMYEWRGEVEKWFREAGEYILQRYQLGEEPPFQKVGMGRAGNRAWTDWDGARRLLRQSGVAEIDMYEHKAISPPTAVDLLRLSLGGTKKANDARIRDFIWQPPGKPTLMSRDDNREALPSAASAFDDLED